MIGRQHSITKQLNQKQRSVLHPSFSSINCVVLQLEKGAYPEHSMLCFVKRNRVRFNLLCVRLFGNRQSRVGG